MNVISFDLGSTQNTNIKLSLSACNVQLQMYNYSMYSTEPKCAFEYLYSHTDTHAQSKYNNRRVLQQSKVKEL